MAIEGTKISALKPIGTKDVSQVYVLGYLDGTSKENYRISYESIKEQVAEDIIDQHYNPESKNAQSGIAVAEAIEKLSTELDGKFANQTDIERIDESIVTINEILDTKADKTTTDTIANELETINSQIEDIGNTLLVHQTQIDNKVTHVELAEKEQEINDSVYNIRENLENHINETAATLDEKINQKVEELDNANKELKNDIQEIKDEILSGSIGGGIDEAELDRILDSKDYVTRDRYNNDISVINENVRGAMEQADEAAKAVAEKATYEYVDREIQNILDDIQDIQNRPVEYDLYVSSNSSNAVTSEGIYNFVTGQGFLTQADVESFKPVEPEIDNLPEGNIEKNAYWFTISPEYLSKGYLTGIRIKTGIQPNNEVEEPEEDDYVYNQYITLTVNKVVRGDDGYVKEFINIGFSSSYIEISDNSWINFEFEDIPISGEDELAFVFCESTYDDGVDRVDGKVLGVVLQTSENETASIYGDSGEEKALICGEVSYNAPKEMTGLNIIDTIYENEYPNWDDGNDDDESSDDENSDDEGDNGNYEDNTYVGLPRVASPVAVMRYVKEKLDALLESGGIEIGPEQLDYISQQVTYSIGAEITAIGTKVDRFKDDIDYILDGQFLTEKLDDIIYEVKEAISGSLTDTENAVNQIKNDIIPSILSRVTEVEEQVEYLSDERITSIEQSVESVSDRVSALENTINNPEEKIDTVGFPNYTNGTEVMNLTNYVSDTSESQPEEPEEDEVDDDSFSGEMVEDNSDSGVAIWEADENCWLHITVTGNGNSASVTINDRVLLEESTRYTNKSLFIPVTQGVVITGKCGYALDYETARVVITKYPIIS